MNHNESAQLETYSLKSFLPLIIMFLLVSTFTLIKYVICGSGIHDAMYDFMGSSFIVFSLFKMINLHEFAEAYSTYDIIAQRFMIYAYIYPFIELMLGVAYLARYQLTIANWATIALMIISSIGVILVLSKGKMVVCACLGTVFKIPMTYVTLVENIGMGLMALIMLMQ